MAPLSGVRVFDLTIAGAGPWASMLLATLGAEVVKIESPDGDMARGVPPLQQGMSTLYITANLNKRSAILNLKDPQQRDLARRLAAASDVFIENFRPGTTERLGLGYDSLRVTNPALVYASLSAYGQTGPMSGLAGNDPQVQAFCGWCSQNGSEHGRPEMYRYFAFIDLISATQAVEGILLALFARTRRGKGQKVEVSMLEAALNLQTTRLASYFADRTLPARLGSACQDTVPHQAFRCQDDRFIAVGVLRDQDWPAFCGVLGLEELAKDPMLATNRSRVDRRNWLVPLLAAEFVRLPAAWWLRQLKKSRLPAGPFLDFDALLNHPQVRENRFIRQISTPWGETYVQGPPWRFEGQDLEVRTSPVPGSDTEAVAAAAGWSGPALGGADHRSFDHRRVGI